MKDFVMQYSFSTIGEENMDILRALHNRLSLMQNAPLSEVYAEFGLLPLHPPTNGDRLESVKVIHTSKTKNFYAFFILTTRSFGSPHSELWTGIGRAFQPHVRVDTIGSSSDGGRFCTPLFVPDNLLLEKEH